MKIEGFSEEEVIKMAEEWYEFNPGAATHHTKTFQQLRKVIWEEKQSMSEELIDRLEDLTEIEMCLYEGKIIGLDYCLDLLINIIKYSDSKPTVQDAIDEYRKDK